MGGNENMVVLAEEPLEGWTPDRVREWMAEHHDDRSLAIAMASAGNQTGWLGHELDNPENPCPEKVYEQWWQLECEILDEIASRCFTEQEWTERKKMGTHRAIEPFMNEHGYVDGAGWWVPEDF